MTPNDTYVVRCSGTGHRRAWRLPDSGPVTDYSEEAFQRSRDKALLRLPNLVIPEDADNREETELLVAAVAEALARTIRPSGCGARSNTSSDQEPARRELDRHPLGGYVLTGKVRLRQFDPTYLDDSEPAESFRGVAVTLASPFSRGLRVTPSASQRVAVWT